MLRATKTNLAFLLLAATLLVVSHYSFIPKYIFILEGIVYASVLFAGSYFIQLKFFIRSVLGAATNEKEIAISFDDGPVPGKTNSLLDIMKVHETEAAFFCIGKNIAGNEEILKRTIAEGHLIGNHSYSHHFFFDLMSSQKMEQDLRQMDLAVQEATGLIPKLFRPPYGVTNPNLARAITRGGYQSVGWTVRSMDTVVKDPQLLHEKMIKALAPGKIFLFHDTSDATRNMLPIFLEEVKRRGYRVVRLDKMCKLKAYD